MKQDLPRRMVWKRAPNPNSRSELNRLTPEEEVRVRTALDVAKIRFGNWKGVAAALKSNKRTLTSLTCLKERITPAYAIRVARMLGVPLGDILAGKFPRAGECPMCGHVDEPDRGFSLGRRVAR